MDTAGSDVVEIMRKICDIVEKEGLANDHEMLTSLLKQRLGLAHAA